MNKIRIPADHPHVRGRKSHIQVSVRPSALNMQPINEAARGQRLLAAGRLGKFPTSIRAEPRERLMGRIDDVTVAAYLIRLMTMLPDLILSIAKLVLSMGRPRRWPSVLSLALNGFYEALESWTRF